MTFAPRNHHDMLHSTPIPEVPKLLDFNQFAWHCSLKKNGYELLSLSKIEGNSHSLPEKYIPPSYALEFLVRGSITGKVNNKFVALKPNDAFFVIADHIHKDVNVSPDAEYYVIGFTTTFAEALNLSIPHAQLAQFIMHPVRPLSDRQMAVVQQYIRLLRVLIEDDRTASVLDLLRSLIDFLGEEAALNPQQTHSLTRPEQICGQFLSLVEIHCRRQHSVEWYADQMHLSAKYLSNILKQTIQTSPNVCIDKALTRQAKSLLSSTSLSVQQISERLGFQNQSHFGTFFKRNTNQNPSAFRLSFK